MSFGGDCMKMIANVCVEREKFINEDYVTDNHLLFVVEEGEFYVSNGNDEASLTKGNALIIIPGIR